MKTNLMTAAKVLFFLFFSLSIVSTDAAAPDLIFTAGITVNPNPIVAGNNLMVSYTVKNSGNATAAQSIARIQVKLGSSGTTTTQVYDTTPALVVGASSPRNVTVPIAGSVAPGAYTVYVILDYNNAIGQSDVSAASDIRQTPTGSLAIQSSAETISPSPNMTGEPNPIQNTAYSYTVNAFSSSLGHTLEYSFNWGDGTASAYSTSRTASHSWSATGPKAITVTARCQTHTAVTASQGFAVTVQAGGEAITFSAGISGETSPQNGKAYTYTVQAQSNLGHTVDYNFTWGDGSSTAFSTSGSAQHSWTQTGSYTVNVTARCQIHQNVLASAAGLSVNVQPSPPSRVASPTFSPAPGVYSAPQNVTIGCMTAEAFIRYTTGSADPTATSPLYTAPIKVAATTTIKARAFKAGMSDSATVSATYTITASPANDVFANAAAISADGVTVTGSNVGATKEPGEPNHAGNVSGKSVWWVWTPSKNGSVTINTRGSSFDTTLAVYTGNAVGSLSSVPNGSNDDFNGMTSSVTITVTAGTTYHIAVDGYSGATGSITLAVLPQSATRIVAYFNGTVGNRNLDYSLVTHLNYFPAIPHEDGTVDGVIFNTLKATAQAVHSKGAKIQISILCNQASTFHTIANNSTSLAAFAGLLAQWCTSYSLDGVDLDWESYDGVPEHTPNPADYQKIIAALRSRLPSGATVSAAVAANPGQISAEVSQSLDWVAVMLYNLRSLDHSRFDDSTTFLTRWEKSGVPRDKLLMGVPFYGRSTVDEKTYGEIVDLAHPAPSADVAPINGVTYYFNGPTTIRQKSQYVKDNGYGGIMVWQLAGDHFDGARKYDSYSLLPAINSVLISKALAFAQMSAQSVQSESMIAGFTYSGARAEVTIASKVGTFYFLEFKNGLSDPEWHYAVSVPGDGDELNLFDPSADVPTRFYRVRQE